MFSLQAVDVSWSRDEVSAWAPHHAQTQRFLTWGPDAPLVGLWDVYSLALKQFADLEFLADSATGRRLTFAQVLTAARAVMRALVVEFKLKPLDRVVVVGRNSIEWIIVFIAASWAGMIAVPMNSWWTGAELAYGLADSQAAVVFADDERMARIDPLLSKLPGVHFVRMERELDALVQRHAASASHVPAGQPAGVKVDSACIIMYTSGTTGHPKGVVITHRSLMHVVNGYLAIGRLGEARAAAAGAPAEALRKCVLLGVPLFHATGLVSVLLTSFGSGRKIVLMRKWDVVAAMRAIETERVTAVTGVPTMVIELLDSPRRAEFDLSSLRNVGGGGAAFPSGVAGAIVKTFAKAAPAQGYGLTETSAVSTLISAADYLQRPTSCGRALPGVQIEIWPEEGGRGALPPGQAGRVMIRGANVMREYWRQPEATAKAITADGWFDSGDVGKLDAEGFLYITDRAKDMIIRGGENISCRAVEEAVYAKVPEVAECAVFGYPHPVLGEKVALAVMLKPGARRLSLADVRARCKDTLAAYELPTALAVFPSQLPRGATGKLLKKALRDMHKEAKLPSWTEHDAAKL